MDKVQKQTPDLLEAILANRFMRNVIAVALLMRVIDIYYDSTTAFLRGLRGGLQHTASSSSNGGR